MQIHTLKKQSNFLYPGSPVCQDYDFKHFYYASCVMNCVFNCDYCFLKGKYSDNKIVVYQNLEDYFKAVEDLLDEIPESEKLYLCVSFDTDLFAIEDKIHYVRRWSEFAKNHDRLCCEVRTKANCADAELWQKIINDNMVFAFSLSPQPIIDEFEHGCASLCERIKSIQMASDMNANVRLCIDPIVYRQGWQNYYKQLIDTISTELNLESIKDISIGTFRIPANYIKTMRKRFPDNPLAQFPYSLVDGFYQYPEYLRGEVEEYVYELLVSVVDKDKIFRWK